MWIDEELRKKVREVFEPRYKRGLSEAEVLEIAENLTGAMKAILRFKWRKTYENAAR